MRSQKTINADLCHEILWKNMEQSLRARKDGQSFEEWKGAIREKFIELTGFDKVAANKCPLNVQIEWGEEKEAHRLIRFTFESEVGEIVPCYLCIPKTGKKKYPVAIVLQGHSTGFHNSIGEVRTAADEGFQPQDEYALQAVENGFIALAIEQRGMGERKPTSEMRFKDVMCRYASLVALQLGRTILAERIWDVKKAIDALQAFSECDLDKILITGHSGGGTTSYYAACMDERIKLSVPNCSFCPYEESILDNIHCNCNYIPSAYRYFDMPDLSCMLAPRRLVVIAGQKDDIFPIEGVRRGFKRTKSLYEEAGAAENCRMIETPSAHAWTPEVSWRAIREEAEKLGWRL